MDIQTYTERATVIFHPDGSVKGSEAHVHTGFVEQRDVPDSPEDASGPAGKVNVFVVTRQEVVAIKAGDFDAMTPGKAALLADGATNLTRAEVAEADAKAARAALDAANARVAELDQLAGLRQAAIDELQNQVEAGAIKARNEQAALREQIARLTPTTSKSGDAGAETAQA